MGFKKDKLIKSNMMCEDIRLIQNTDSYYISNTGNVYKKINDLFFKMNTFTNRHNGYVYCNIIDKNGRTIGRRVHKLVAMEFLPNPNNYPVIDHKDDIKHHNYDKNLQWCTVSYNTKKAFDTGVLKNKKSYMDDQSHPVIMYDKYSNEELNRFGSVSEASRETGYDKTTICRQCKYNKPARKPYYFRYDNNVSQTTIENWLNKQPTSRVDQMRNSSDRSTEHPSNKRRPIYKISKDEDIV